MTQIKNLLPRRRTISAFATKLVPAPTGFYILYFQPPEQTVVPMTTFAREFA